jgi:imidazoleglycerol-phosphate dehydratase
VGSQRSADIRRGTGETRIAMSLAIDGSGTTAISTPVPFMSHMLDQIGRHGYYDLKVDAQGDTDIDAHHSTEDLGIVLGSCFRDALGDRKGIARFAHAQVPLDEALVQVTVDFSGRPYLVYDLPLPKTKIGTFDVELVREFYQGWVNSARANLHVRYLAGDNLHHIIEASFKAFARATHLATRLSHPAAALPSSKGHLD